jgi:hypothetical protein
MTFKKHGDSKMIGDPIQVGKKTSKDDSKQKQKKDKKKN